MKCTLNGKPVAKCGGMTSTTSSSGTSHSISHSHSGSSSSSAHCKCHKKTSTINGVTTSSEECTKDGVKVPSCPKVSLEWSSLRRRRSLMKASWPSSSTSMTKSGSAKSSHSSHSSQKSHSHSSHSHSSQTSHSSASSNVPFV